MICLNTGINCTNSGGFAVKALIKNLGTLNIDIFSFWLRYKDVSTGYLGGATHGTRIYSGRSKIITGFTTSNYGISEFISPVLVPGEERTVYLHFNLEDESFITTEMNFPCELKLQFISLRNPTFQFDETFPFYGLEAKYSNKITLQSWPTCINCLPTPFSTSIF